MRHKLIFFFTICLATAYLSLDARPLPEVTQAALDEMGIAYGVPQMSGFIFVNGRYLPPPYTVTRRGNAIFINRYQIEQPVAWSYFDSTAIEVPESTDLGEVDVAGGAGEQGAGDAAPAKVSSVEDLFAEDAKPNVGTASVEKGPQTIRSIDDLFGDDPADEKPAISARANNNNGIDSLFTDDEPQKKPVVNPGKPQVVSVKELKSTIPQTTEQLQSKKEILKKRLDEKREAYERAIAKGELYFFNTSHNQINGNYGTARTLLEVLPGALRYSSSPSDLMNRLRAGHIYFIDLTTCEALYRNKTTFPLLQQRLDNIKEMEYLKASRKE